jgi:hypothetical protein
MTGDHDGGQAPFEISEPPGVALRQVGQAGKERHRQPPPSRRLTRHHRAKPRLQAGEALPRLVPSLTDAARRDRLRPSPDGKDRAINLHPESWECRHRATRREEGAAYPESRWVKGVRAMGCDVPSQKGDVMEDHGRDAPPYERRATRRCGENRETESTRHRETQAS